MFTVKVVKKTGELSEQVSIYEVDTVQIQHGPFESEDGKTGFGAGVTKVTGYKNDEGWAIYIHSDTDPADRGIGEILAVYIENSNGKTTEIIR